MMKDRMYSYTVMTFFFMLFFIFLQQAFQFSSYGMSASLFLYAIVCGLITGIIMECWRYLLPLLYPVRGWVYISLFLLHPLLWFTPIFKTIAFALYLIYLAILMANQLFVYGEANEQLKKMQEHLE